MPNGVDAELFSPGRRTHRACASGSGSRPTRSSPRSSPRSTAPTTSSGSTSRSTALAALATSAPPRRRRRRRAAGRLPRAARRAAASASASTSSARSPTRELPDVLRASDLFLLTTEPPESFGIVLIEAMACRPAGDRDRLPGRPGGRRRRQTGAAGRRRATPAAVAAALASWSPPGPGGATRDRRRRAAPRPSASGAGRACSTAWTAPTRRRSQRAGERTAPMSRSILLVAYFYPPCRDTGRPRPAAMAK